MPGGCKFRNSCMFAHSQQKPEVSGIRLNFLGLPIRTVSLLIYLHISYLETSLRCAIYFLDWLFTLQSSYFFYSMCLLFQGEKECPYYMRTGSCKFSSNCWFNHPDPTVVTAQDCVLEYQNGGSPKRHASAEMNMPNHIHSFNQTVTHLDSLPSYIPSFVPPPKGFNFNPNLRSQVTYGLYLFIIFQTKEYFSAFAIDKFILFLLHFTRVCL